MLSQITQDISTFLLDASGVIYNADGVIHNIPNTIKALQKQRTVVIVTNNSHLSPEKISEKLHQFDISIPASHIISSGHGLTTDPELKTLLQNQKVYILGKPSAHAYFDGLNCKFTSPKDAAIVVLMSLIRGQDEPQFEELKNILIAHPKPIICCNPDHYIRYRNTSNPVIGYYATQLESLGLPIIWMGKPFTRFSDVVHTKLSHITNYSPESTCFFDDNLNNVLRLKLDLNIKGCWVKESGITQPTSKHLHIPVGKPDFVIPQLSF